MDKKTLDELFEVRDSDLYWRKARKPGMQDGERAGSSRANGRRYVRVSGKSYTLHQMLFLHAYGWLPDRVEYVDRNPLNNQASNLRAATRLVPGQLTDREMNFDLAQSLWSYSEGKLYWKVKVGRGPAVKHPGQEAGGAPDPLGYVFVNLKHVRYAVHRIVFLLHHGYFPDCVDHINGNTSDNRIENLRPATRLQNQYNRKPNRVTKSGVKGVSPTRNGKRWHVKLSFGGRTKHIGTFDDLELAELVAIEARELYHGEFARHA